MTPLNKNRQNSNKVDDPIDETLALASEKENLVLNAQHCYKPYYLRMIEIFGQSSFYWLPTMTGMALLPYLLGLLLSIVLAYKPLPDLTRFMLYVPIGIIVGILLLRSAYHLMVNPRNIQYILDGICDQKSVCDYKKWLGIMFRSRQQVKFISIVVLFVISSAILFIPAYPNELKELPFWYILYGWIYIGYAVILVGPGIWLAITSMGWVGSYLSQYCLQMQIIRPHRHGTLRIVSSILSSYALYFSIETSLALSAFFALNWETENIFYIMVRNLWLIIFILYCAT